MLSRVTVTLGYLSPFAVRIIFGLTTLKPEAYKQKYFETNESTKHVISCKLGVCYCVCIDLRKKQTRVKVVIRVRPPLSADAKVCVSTTGDSKVEIFNHRNVRENLQYQFSSVFDKSSTQRDVFDAYVRPLLNHALEGENVSIFAYGPTGAGKTYTMLGTEDDPGMIPRVIHTLFQSLTSSTTCIKFKDSKKESHRVSFSFLEIYNEKVQDLLNPKETDLPIREDAMHNIFVAGLTEKTIHSFDDFKNLFGPASNNRTVAATKLNDRSSRSHSIVQLRVDTFRAGKVFHGKIYLIDLAGSEDNRRTGNQGIRLKESGAINKSLFVLGEVVDAINNNLPRIPYRNSKLTRLLQDSIGGSCHSVMITNVAPEESYYYDTYCTLNFASKSRKVVNSSVTSVTDIQPPEPPKSLKRTNSATQVHSTAKKAKLSAQKSQSDSNLSTSQTAPIIPLVQRQNHLERTVKGCMQKMEDLLHRVNGTQSQTSAQTSSSPGDSTVAEIHRQLLEVKAQLRELQQQKEQKPGGGSAGKPDTHKPQERRRSLRKALASVPPLDSIVLKDKTNLATEMPKQQKARARVEDDGPSCSPLFPDTPPLQKFKKGFKSTALSRGTAGCVTPHRTKKDASNFSAQQQKQNEEFLEILNEAPVKRLQDLHTVGAKRARLIFEWRQTQGPFTSFEDLRRIPGFTEKYVSSLLQVYDRQGAMEIMIQMTKHTPNTSISERLVQCVGIMF
ncbi:hypothetical protein BaRGS_00020791 [Batillaria attramentaria]|uniref:Kinesin-like protein n=1 Tax=Batillaria attramentaria TaxID=370345 RepID=A0ABD0KL11_9CAEN